MSHATPTLIPEQTPKRASRFWSKVNKDGPILKEELGPCWIWTGCLTEHKYGQLSMEYSRLKAHRVAFVWEYGEPPESKPHILHQCDNPSCVRPSHMFLGTHQDNMRDRDAKGRVGHGDNHYAKRDPSKIRRGDDRPWRSKLTELRVREMRKLHFENSVPIKSLADESSVTYATAWDAIKGKTWAHVV